MKRQSQKGFSLIELIMVITIISVLATITIPFLLKARSNAENGNAFASLRTTASAQLSYYSQNRRYARLNELNEFQVGSLGIVSGNELIRGKFSFQMSPDTPTDEELRSGYRVIATKAVVGSDTPYVISVTESGQITQILP